VQAVRDGERGVGGWRGGKKEEHGEIISLSRVRRTEKKRQEREGNILSGLPKFNICEGRFFFWGGARWCVLRVREKGGSCQFQVRGRCSRFRTLTLN